jgi:hypothetical protein
MRRIFFGWLGVTAVLLTGCGGSTSTGSTNPCGPPSGTSTVLVYPAATSTGIPDNVGLIVLGSTVALPASYSVLVVNNSTQNSAFFNPVGAPPNPIPNPNMVPVFANPVYQSSGNPGLTFVAGSSVSVYLNNSNSTCVPTSLLGTFSVQ